MQNDAHAGQLYIISFMYHHKIDVHGCTMNWPSYQAYTSLNIIDYTFDQQFSHEGQLMHAHCRYSKAVCMY